MKAQALKRCDINKVESFLGLLKGIYQGFYKGTIISGFLEGY